LLHNIDREKLEFAILHKLNKNVEQNKEIEEEVNSRPTTPTQGSSKDGSNKHDEHGEPNEPTKDDEEDEEETGIKIIRLTSASRLPTFGGDTEKGNNSGNNTVEQNKPTLVEAGVHQIVRSNSYIIVNKDIKGWRYPESLFKKYWNIMLMAGVVYFIVITPVRLAFVEGVPIGLYAVDGVLDVLYIVDAILRAQYFTVLSNGKLYKTKTELWSMYKKESLVKDLITSIPFGLFALLQMNQPVKPLHATLWTLALLRTNKLMHVRRLFSLGIHIKSLLGLFTLIIFIGNSVGAMFYMLARLKANYPGEPKYDACVRSMMNASLPVLTRAYSAELTTNVTEAEAAGLCMWEGTWMGLQFTDNLLPLTGGSQMERSLRSFNWAMPTLLVVVIGDTTPVNLTETLFVIVSILFGLIVNAMVLGVMADRLTDTASEQAKHRANMDMVERWLLLSNIGDNVILCDRIRDHMRTTFHITKGVDEEQIYKEMPRQLRHDSAKILRVPQLQRCDVLEHVSVAFLQALAERLLFRHYSGGDVICIQGEYLSEMFVIKIGTVELVSGGTEFVDEEEEEEEGGNMEAFEPFRIPQVASGLKTVEIVEAGGSFGGLSMVSHQPIDQSAEAMEHVAMYVLKRYVFLDILNQFPDETNNIPNLRMLKSRRRRSSSGGGGGGDSVVDKAQAIRESNHSSKKESEADKEIIQINEKYIKQGSEESNIHRNNSNERISELISTADYKYNWATWAGRWQLHSLFRDIWAVVSLINLFYFLVLIPLRASVLIEERVTTAEMFAWYTYGYLVDVFFLVDMYFRARKFHVSVDDIVISESAEISARYFSARSTTGTLNTDNNKEHVPWWYPSEFVVDLLSSLPLDVLAFGLGMSSLKFLRINRLLRSLWRLPEILETTDRFVHQKFHLWSGFYSLVVKVWVTFWLANHLCACGYIFIHRYFERNVEFTWATVDGVSTWDPVKGEHDIFHDRTLAYNRAFYFVIVVVSTCGYGDIRPYTNFETLFAQFVTLCGALSLASMVGTFLFYFQYFDASGTIGIQQRFRGVMEYGDKHKWKYLRIKQLQRQCDYIWEETRFLSERSVLDLLSIPLQMEVVAITRGHILLGAHLMRNIKTLKRCSLYLATCLRLEVFVRGQQIYHFGEPTVGFFIVSEGAVDVMKENDSWDTTLENSLTRSSSHTGQMNNTIRPIGHFGAWSRKYKCRVDSAVAVEDSHVYRCSVEDMFEVLERMSEMDAADFVKDILV